MNFDELPYVHHSKDYEPKAARLPDEDARPAGAASGTNWSLTIGSLMVLLVLLLSILGPYLAPNDPNKENYIFITGPRDFLRPPVPAFTLPGYPFGTDEFGRDILSRLLYAIGPTMNLVLVVAAIRLTIGTIIGLISGWMRNWFEQVLDTLTSGAIAIPVLFVALFVIAATGQRMGLGAFVIGLSLTGWAETARIIREQTRVIKGQTYIEASMALGASGRQSLTRHVLPQVLPLIWVLLPVEASSALLTTAALGFLGYFANVIWIPTGDWTTLRASGSPDLGEMLALSAKGAQYQPWSMLAAGLIVFITIMGFNLLGDGLRIRFAPGAHRRRSRLGAVFARAQTWLEDRWFGPLNPVRQNAPTFLAIGGLLVILAVGGFTLAQAQARQNLKSTISVPGGQLWANTAHDPQGTKYVDVTAPSNPTATWVYIAELPIAGGPVVAADGTVYLSIGSDQLVAVSSEGKKLWQVTIPREQGQEGITAPAIGPDGTIYVVGFNGSLSAVTPQGSLKWTILQDVKTNQVLTSPIVDAQGNIYYATDPKVYAVAAQGEVIWKEFLPTYSYTDPSLRISGDGKYLLFEDTIMDITNGRTLVKSTMNAMDEIVVGTDGELYILNPDMVNQLTLTAESGTLKEIASWDVRPLSLNYNVLRNGGRLPSGMMYIEFGSIYTPAKIIWIDSHGTVLTPLDLPYDPVRITVAFDHNDTMITCGSLQSQVDENTALNGECRANAPGDTRPLWKFSLSKEDKYPVGGALVPGRVYVTAGNTLYALQDP